MWIFRSNEWLKFVLYSVSVFYFHFSRRTTENCPHSTSYCCEVHWETIYNRLKILCILDGCHSHFLVSSARDITVVCVISLSITGNEKNGVLCLGKIFFMVAALDLTLFTAIPWQTSICPLYQLFLWHIFVYCHMNVTLVESTCKNQCILQQYLDFLPVNPRPCCEMQEQPGLNP